MNNLLNAVKLYDNKKVDVKVIFENGNSFITGINLNFEEATAYYLGKYFNLGSVGDDMQKCIKVELV